MVTVVAAEGALKVAVSVLVVEPTVAPGAAPVDQFAVLIQVRPVPVAVKTHDAEAARALELKAMLKAATANAAILREEMGELVSFIRPVLF